MTVLSCRQQLMIYELRSEGMTLAVAKILPGETVTAILTVPRLQFGLYLWPSYSNGWRLATIYVEIVVAKQWQPQFLRRAIQWIHWAIFSVDSRTLFWSDHWNSMKCPSVPFVCAIEIPLKLHEIPIVLLFCSICSFWCSFCQPSVLISKTLATMPGSCPKQQQQQQRSRGRGKSRKSNRSFSKFRWVVFIRLFWGETWRDFSVWNRSEKKLLLRILKQNKEKGNQEPNLRGFMYLTASNPLPMGIASPHRKYCTVWINLSCWHCGIFHRLSRSSQNDVGQVERQPIL